MEIKLPVFNTDFVETLIPQKKPFVMVDSLISYSEKTLESAFTPNENHIFMEKGIFQAAGILEHQAQSVALHTGYECFMNKKTPPIGYIGAVKSFEIFSLPRLGEKIESEVEILEELMGVTLVKVSTKINGKEIAKSEMKTVLKK